MTDQAQLTAWALQQFAGFVENWAPHAMPGELEADIAKIQRAIRAIAPPIREQVVGYGVFGQVPDRERDNGFEHIAISAIMETQAQAENVMDGSIARAKKALAVPPVERERQLLGGSVVRLDEIDRYVICKVQQISG